MLINNIEDLRRCLTETRNARKISIRRLAELTGISPTHIVYIEQGKRVPSFEIVMKICEALSVSIEIKK